MNRPLKLAPRRKRQSGVALLIALFVLMLLSAIGLGMMYATNTETSINANFKDKQVAIYGSLSGIQEARDRMIPSVCASGASYAICPPATPPSPTSVDSSQTVIYIINPKGGETIDPTDYTTNTSNPYFDTDLCHENIFGLTAALAGDPCPISSASMPTPSSTAWRGTFVNDSNSSSAPWNLSLPLTTKWTRIIRKSNNLGASALAVNGNSADNTILCWDGNHEVPLPTGYDPTTCGPTHSITAIQFNPTTVTQSTGWTYIPVLQIPAPTTAGGVQAVAQVVTTGAPTDSISGVDFTCSGCTGGSGYTSTPNVQFTSATGGGAVGVANMAYGAPVTGFASSPAPSLTNQCYAPGTTPALVFTGGSGNGAQGHGVLGTTLNCVYDLKISANCPPNTTVQISSITGGGSTATGLASSTQVATGSGSGNLSNQSFTISNPGTGYNGSSINVVVSQVGNASNTCSHVNAYPSFGYNIASLVLDAGGNNYTTAPAVTVAGGTGSTPDTATATLGTMTSGIVSVSMTAGGSGYPTSGVTVSFPCPGGGASCHPGGTAAVGNPVIAATYTVTGFDLTCAGCTGGSGYGAIPAVSMVCPTGHSPCGGDGAPIKAVLSGTANLTYGMVYQLTSLGYTTSGAKAMTQADAVTNVRGLAMTGALTLDGPMTSTGINMPNSSGFYVSGLDSAYPGTTSCGTTAQAHPAIGVYDDPNANPPTSSLTNVVAAIPSGRTSNYYGSGPSPDVQNVYGSLGDTLGTTTGLQSLAEDIYAQASINGTLYGNNPGSIALGTATDPVVDYVNGNLTIGGSTAGYGTLLVTGTLTFNGNFGWNGLILAIGTGNVVFTGGGNKNIDGELIVAPICGGTNTPCQINNSGVQSPNWLLTTQGNPSFTFNGGGTNNIQMDSCAVSKAMSGFYTTIRPQSTPLLVVSSHTITY